MSVLRHFKQDQQAVERLMEQVAEAWQRMQQYGIRSLLDVPCQRLDRDKWWRK